MHQTNYLYFHLSAIPYASSSLASAWHTLAAYNLAMERLIATSKAPINYQSSILLSSDTNNAIFTKCAKWLVFPCAVTNNYGNVDG